jgi:hypothetical protein
MNRKPLWGLWLLMIVAPLAVVGIFRKRPDVIVEPPRLIKLTAFGEPKNDMELQFLCHNFSSGEVEANFRVIAGADELHVPGGAVKWQDGRVLSKTWFSIPDYAISITAINQNRHQIVKIQLDWKTATQAGSQIFVITPQMKP